MTTNLRNIVMMFVIVVLALGNGVALHKSWLLLKNVYDRYYVSTVLDTLPAGYDYDGTGLFDNTLYQSELEFAGGDGIFVLLPPDDPWATGLAPWLQVLKSDEARTRFTLYVALPPQLNVLEVKQHLDEAAVAYRIFPIRDWNEFRWRTGIRSAPTTIVLSEKRSIARVVVGIPSTDQTREFVASWPVVTGDESIVSRFRGARRFRDVN